MLKQPFFCKNFFRCVKKKITVLFSKYVCRRLFFLNLLWSQIFLHLLQVLKSNFYITVLVAMCIISAALRFKDILFLKDYWEIFNLCRIFLIHPDNKNIKTVRNKSNIYDIIEWWSHQFESNICRQKIYHECLQTILTL